MAEVVSENKSARQTSAFDIFHIRDAPPEKIF
jgi:hypothetical protein